MPTLHSIKPDKIKLGTKKAASLQPLESLSEFLVNSLAPRPGLEPGTCGLTVRRSTD